MSHCYARLRLKHWILKPICSALTSMDDTTAWIWKLLEQRDSGRLSVQDG